MTSPASGADIVYKGLYSGGRGSQQVLLQSLSWRDEVVASGGKRDGTQLRDSTAVAYVGYGEVCVYDGGCILVHPSVLQ